MTKTATRAIDWTLTTGQHMHLAIMVMRGKQTTTQRYNLDGDICYSDVTSTVETQTMTVTCNDDVLGSASDQSYRIAKDARFAACSMLLYTPKTLVGIADAKVADSIRRAIEDARAEAEADNTSWAEVLAARAGAAEYRRHVKAVEDMMTLGGTTY